MTGSEASENRALRELLLLISANEPEVATWTGLVSNLFLGLPSCLLFSTIVCLRCSTFDVFIWSCAGMLRGVSTNVCIRHVLAGRGNTMVPIHLPLGWL